jgi:hypothetical protein
VGDDFEERLRMRVGNGTDDLVRPGDQGNAHARFREIHDRKDRSRAPPS